MPHSSLIKDAHLALTVPEMQARILRFAERDREQQRSEEGIHDNRGRFPGLDMTMDRRTAAAGGEVERRRDELDGF